MLWLIGEVNVKWVVLPFLLCIPFIVGSPASRSTGPVHP
jgi:hypothetical protein